jgi:regulator of chromosome condensation (RCC1) repeat-containing protein/Regulator of Chromosome Condensation (RCC1) repeat protein
MRTRVRGVSLTLGLVGAVLGGVSCRGDDTLAPSSPDIPEAGPAFATASTTALAFYQLSGGNYHTCGVTTDNRAYCWGTGDAGERGDGTNTWLRPAPAPVIGTLRFQQVSAGSAHTCGVTTDYRAYCWGLNYEGQLGDGSKGPYPSTPSPVAGGLRFRQVSAGAGFTCAVSYPDERAYCWGRNLEGELGDGTQTRRLTPVAVVGGRKFHQVSAGQKHTCGLTPSGEAFCWGESLYGQLGDGSYRVPSRATPFPVVGGRRFRQIDAGTEFTCAATTDYRAFCWGNGRRGQLGNGKTSLSFWPRAVAGGLSFERVTTGRRHACGETTGNRAYCWGANYDGELGDGTTTLRLTPVPVAGGLSFSQLSAGRVHTCGRTPAAVAYCWGKGASGQLGDGSLTFNRTTPVRVVGAM